MTKSFDKLPQEKRDLIINTSMDAFIRYGYVKANTVDIVKECGIAKGSLFHYFESKKALFLYVVTLCSERMLSETRDALSKIEDKSYFDRIRKSTAFKMRLPLKYPKETSLLARAFAEQGHEAADELKGLAVRYAMEMRDLNTRYIGEIEPELLKDSVSLSDARVFIQTVFDGIVTRLLKQYAANPGELLERPEVLSFELEKAIGFILYGIGK